jgi:hypothetical protein
MPAKTAELWRRLGTGLGEAPRLDRLAALEPNGWQVERGGEVLFPRPELKVKSEV